MSHEGGEVLFDGQLDSGLDIATLWASGKPFNVLSSKSDMRQADGLLIRELLSWRFEHEDIESAEAMQARIDTAERHFRKLRDLGMSIVTHSTVVSNTEWPGDPHANNGENVMGYSASAYVPNITALDSSDVLQLVPETKVEEFVFEPVRKYVKWGTSTKEPQLLFDLFTGDQYSWHEDTGVIFLHDIDPHLGPSDHIGEVMDEDLASFFESIG